MKLAAWAIYANGSYLKSSLGISIIFTIYHLNLFLLLLLLFWTAFIIGVVVVVDPSETLIISVLELVNFDQVALAWDII